ncbi:MAG: hypothetical protein AB1801_22135, partial [Chloroflexota bacterium]
MSGIFPVRQSKFYLPLLLALLAAWLLTSSRPAAVEAQSTSQETNPAVEAIFNALSPQERVGQLFMVSFQGSEVTVNSEIGQLIQEYRLGGVVLSAANQNFPNSNITPARLLALTNALQLLAQESPLPGAGAVNTTPTLTGTVET